MSQGKSKTTPMQIFLGVEAVYYGIVQVENSTENSGNSGMKVKWNGNFQEKIWVYLTRLSSFSEFMQIPNFLFSAS